MSAAETLRAADAARQRFEQLPECITIHRGTVEAEGGRYGVSWTLDPERAAWFAKGYRCSNRESPPVVLTCEIDRSAASGLLVERSESEVIVHPGAFKDRKVTRTKPTARRRPAHVPVAQGEAPGKRRR